MSKTVDILLDMGFPQEKINLALSNTKSDDISVIMDWLVSHEDEGDDATTGVGSSGQVSEGSNLDDAVPSTSTASTSESEPVAVAKSIKCDECGKLFTSTVEVEFHATKSGHEKFSESSEEKKALTEEEKKEQLAKIEAKLKQRRLEREAQEKLEAQQREKARIKSGKELLEVKKKHEEMEMKKLLEQRKREKDEERKARERVRQQIEADKLARKAKLAETTGQSIVTTTTNPQESVVVEKKPQNYSQVKLQIRLMNGKTLVQNFGIKEPLSAVRLYIEMNRNDADGPFKLMTSFPRKVFTSEDYEKPLESLDLAPAALLIVTKT